MAATGIPTDKFTYLRHPVPRNGDSREATHLFHNSAAADSGAAWRIGVYFVQKQAQEQQRIAVLKAPPVIVVAPVGTRLITSYFDTTGTVQAPFNVNIACKVIGRVTYLKVREGTQIHKGQILAKIDNLAYLAQARQAKAAVVEANHRLVQAQYLTNPTNVNVDTQIGEQVAGVAGSTADYSESVRNYGRQVAAAQQAVNDAQARVKGARSAAAAAQATYKDAKAKYVRNYQLYRQGFVAAQDAEDALAAELVAQNNLETANQTLNSQAAQLESGPGTARGDADDEGEPRLWTRGPACAVQQRPPICEVQYSSKAVITGESCRTGCHARRHKTGSQER